MRFLCGALNAHGAAVSPERNGTLLRVMQRRGYGRAM